MAEDRQRVRRFDGREECAHASAEAATDERDPVVGAQRVTRGAQIFELRRVPTARTLATGTERDGAAVDIESPERARERAQDALFSGAAVSRREDRRTRHRDFARIFGS